LTTDQAAALLSELSPLPRTMVGLAIILGPRRGEIFALRLRHIDEQKQVLSIQEAVYDTTFSTPTTDAGSRQIPLSELARQLIAEWKTQAENTAPDALVFATSQGTPILPNNVVRRSIAPACKRLGLPKATWLTFRRTYSTWSHERGVPGKVTAQPMGHANVDTTLNVYTQVLDGSVREAADRVSGELFTAIKAGGNCSRMFTNRGNPTRCPAW
jgi:integrase